VEQAAGEPADRFKMLGEGDILPTAIFFVPETHPVAIAFHSPGIGFRNGFRLGDIFLHA
jgi:hypothetical protein